MRRNDCSKLSLPGLSTLLVAGALTLPVGADEVDFEGLDTGLITSSVNSAGGVGPILVNGFNPSLGAVNAAVIFDSSNPTGGDPDLGSPNETFGGPGVGDDGESGQPNQNDTALGKILIIAEDLDVDNNGLVIDPDDADVAGATLEFDFSSIGTATIHSVGFIDVENDRVGDIELFDAGGTSLGLFNMVVLGDNGVGSIDTASTSGVARMLITLGGSGAFSGFDFDQDIDDCDNDGIPDDQEPDCDSNGTPDDCEPAEDCDSNGIPDRCDILQGAVDIDGNGIPDRCEPGTRTFCLGQDETGGTLPCPCGNEVVPGANEGCANNTGVGAALSSSGSTSIAAADLVLHVSQVPNAVPGYFFAGSNPVATGNGVPFFNGLRCIGGQIIRISKIPSAIGGNASYPPQGGIPVSTIVGAVPGDISYLQFWYRDPGGPCGGSANMSNALSVTWTL